QSISTYFTSRHCAPRHHPSFPTRRSSDLSERQRRGRRAGPGDDSDLRAERADRYGTGGGGPGRNCDSGAGPDSVVTRTARYAARSEEHTSELQSPYDLVCRLLLEKKKNKI